MYVKTKTICLGSGGPPKDGGNNDNDGSSTTDDVDSESWYVLNDIYLIII